MVNNHSDLIMMIIMEGNRKMFEYIGCALLCQVIPGSFFVNNPLPGITCIICFPWASYTWQLFW